MKKKSKSFPLETKREDFLTGYLDTERSKKPKEIISESVTRQTFMITVSTLEKLKDYVHTKRKYENYLFSQKQAIEDALQMLFSSIDNIEKRNE